MDAQQTAAYHTLEQAQQALKTGDKHTARLLAEQAARTAPEMEEVWLMLARLGSPRASVAYLEKALQINPQSERAQKGMVWAQERLLKAAQPPIEKGNPAASKTTPENKKKKPAGFRLTYVLFALIVVCLGAAAFALSVTNPVAAFFGANLFAARPKDGVAAQINLARETGTVSPSETVLPTATVTPTLTPTITFTPTVTATFTPVPTDTPTSIPSETPTEEASPTPLSTDTPEPLPTQAPAAPVVQAPAPARVTGSSSSGAHWIDVNLSQQMVYAYEGQTIVNSFLVSTGTAQYRTVTGSYHIYEKHVTGNMWGPGYFLPNVPYIMYFYKGYGLHGTYWHSNFGTPMSHGCVNLSTPDAQWLYSWAPMGTLVKVHY